jgi:hypothetical protein
MYKAKVEHALAPQRQLAELEGPVCSVRGATQQAVGRRGDYDWGGWIDWPATGPLADWSRLPRDPRGIPCALSFHSSLSISTNTHLLQHLLPNIAMSSEPPSNGAGTGSKRKRTAQACGPCRTKKTKASSTLLSRPPPVNG